MLWSCIYSTQPTVSAASAQMCNTAVLNSCENHHKNVRNMLWPCCQIKLKGKHRKDDNVISNSKISIMLVRCKQKQSADTLARSDHWNERIVTSRRCNNICRLHSYSWRNAWLTSITASHCFSDKRALSKGRLMASGHLLVSSLTCTCGNVNRALTMHLCPEESNT